jgi:gliding motility-associated-like protein
MCFGSNDGSATAIVNGGFEPYSFLWSTNDTSQSIINMSSGTYYLTVTDINSCSETGQVQINEPANPLNLNIAISNISCSGENDGYINSQAIGGTPPYTYYWQYNEYTSTSTNLNNLYADNYNLIVTDANDCIFDTLVRVSEPAPIDATFNFGNPSCIGNNDGFIELAVIGGTEPYLFEWNGGASPIEYLEGLIQGTYTVTITDENGCLYELNPIYLEDVDEDCIRIPNAFTPNSDGINDTWIIENLDMFPNAYIHVYNRWGQQLFEAKGSDDPWDGTYNGKFVPTGTYIYLIELFNGSKPYTGTISVVY